MSTAVALLHEARAAGIELYLANGQVRFRGPDTVVSKFVPALRQHKPELIELLSTWRELEAAINACCSERGDSQENRTALLADCWQEPASKWAWFVWYFKQEAARGTH